MKRILALLIALMLILSGCGSEVPGQTDPTQANPNTLTGGSWLEANATSWDEEGCLVEIPLAIPGGLHYASFEAFNGDILFWSIDDHRENTKVVELCLFDLDTGTVAVCKDISFGGYVQLQVLADRLYLICHETGEILQLNSSLEILETWNTSLASSSWFMGNDEKLYTHTYEGEFLVQDLNTGELTPVLKDDPYVEYVKIQDSLLQVDYIREDTGKPGYAVVDLISGEVAYLEASGEYLSAEYRDGCWLYGKYSDGYTWYLQREGETVQQLSGTGDSLHLLEDGKLLRIPETYTHLQLCDTTGKALAQCRLTYHDYQFTGSELIWNEQFGGYFIMLSSYTSEYRLLFWDTSVSQSGADILFTEAVTAEEEELLLYQRADELSKEYGVSIYVAGQCDTQFGEFYAEQILDYDRTNAALDILEEVLSQYPEGFFRQLHYGNIRSIRIHLVTNLIADGTDLHGDGYAAFTQNMLDHYLVVVDIEDADRQTYYHEFSHIIDGYLEWDAAEREDALFSERAWAALNPEWFDDYSYDYSREIDIRESGYFVDGYATIRPTEDRARVMEYAMSEYGFYTFEDAPGLKAKLEYYCLCIRDAFDTTGWPDVLPWEQYLE